VAAGEMADAKLLLLLLIISPPNAVPPLFLHTLCLLLLHMYLPANRQKQVDNGLDMYRPEYFATFLPFLFS
jgi:hypothetical protein